MECIKCEKKVKVNYSCYDSNKGEVYICNDCESEYTLDEIQKELAYDYQIILDY